MRVLYENEVKQLGVCVDEFKDANMIIIFGDNAPEEIRDYCYSVSVNPIDGELAAGQILKIGNEEFRITAVGEEAPVTLRGLGHCTINFNGSTQVELPGTLYVENKPIPNIEVGTKIQIFEK